MLLVSLLVLFSLPFTVFATENLEAIEVLDHVGSETLVDFVAPSIVLKEEDLRKKRKSTIGETLQNEAGVTSTGFGPNSSRPVIRGLDGARIKVLQNGLQILDASTQSLDHNIPVDPLIVDQIEIVKGPMGLLYGSGAVGGVVNIVTNRIHTTYQEGRVIELQSQGETVNNGLGSSLRFDYGKDKWMLHFDGSTRNAGDQKIPSYARNKYQRQNVPLDAGQGEEKGKLPNSAVQQDTIGVGATRFFDRGSLGLAYNHYQSDYGTVVSRDSTINMLQNRLEFNGEYAPQSDIWKKIRLKSAQSNYKHAEIENHQTGTVFKNSGIESRLEAMNEKGMLKGVTGLQHQYTDFSALGDEAFVPSSKTNGLSLFTFQELMLDKNVLSAGGRVEQTDVNGPSNLGFTGLNGSLGYRRLVTEKDSVSLSYSYTERAPNFQELFADGEHIATGTYERGDTSLKKEKSHGVELGFKHQEGPSFVQASIYAQRFQNYISLLPTGGVAGTDNLSEYVYRQVGAEIYGLDIDAKKLVSQNNKGQFFLVFRGDYLRGKNRDSGDSLPRLTPLRVTGGAEFVSDRLQSDLEVQHVTSQSHTAPSETRVPNYTLTNVGGQYSFFTERSKFDVFLRVRNIFNVEARSNVSFIKDIAPMPGRNIILGVHWLL